MTPFVRSWARAIADNSCVRLTPAELEQHLRPLADRLAQALADDSDTPAVAQEVGAALVRDGMTEPAALRHTLKIVGEFLAPPPGEDVPLSFTRWTELLASLAAGHEAALQERTFAEQDGMRRAALVAQGRAEARYRHLSLHDPLTGLPNRTLLGNRLRAIFAKAAAGARVGMCFVDLDRFKAVNDTLGHATGDLLLAEVARRLEQAASQQGNLLARWGGDEFIIVVADSAGLGHATAVADRVLTALASPVQAGGHLMSVSASIGIVERPVAGTGPDELLRDADMTMYWAKSDGGGRWALFDAQRNIRQVIRHQLAAALPAAIGTDEFEVDYQPIVGLATGMIVGAEALVRWRHPILGLRGPDDFIGLAEETGLIDQLGRWVLERACEQARLWRDDPIDAPFVSVNLAARQTRDPCLVDDVIRALDAAALPMDRLQLEITETAITQTDRETLTSLGKLADLGVRLALDDFGTGYCNLAYLGKLPVHGIKLARSFTERIESPDPADRRVLAGVIGLARDIGLHITVEGIETEEHARQLAELGCDTGQGWNFGHPVPSHDIRARCQRETPRRARTPNRHPPW
jgi:diguanylate cyclase (GGDEF)-like protein